MNKDLEIRRLSNLVNTSVKKKYLGDGWIIPENVYREIEEFIIVFYGFKYSSNKQGNMIEDNIKEIFNNFPCFIAFAYDDNKNILLSMPKYHVADSMNNLKQVKRLALSRDIELNRSMLYNSFYDERTKSILRKIRKLRQLKKKMLSKDKSVQRYFNINVIDNDILNLRIQAKERVRKFLGMNKGIL